MFRDNYHVYSKPSQQISSRKTLLSSSIIPQKIYHNLAPSNIDTTRSKTPYGIKNSEHKCISIAIILFLW